MKNSDIPISMSSDDYDEEDEDEDEDLDFPQIIAGSQEGPQNLNDTNISSVVNSPKSKAKKILAKSRKL